MPDPATQELDERLQIAIRVATQHRMSAFSALVDAHRRHETFQTCGWPLSREMGFTCRCTGEEREYRVSLRSLVEMLPEAREAFLRLHRHRSRAGAKKQRREQRKATVKSKALLHRFLSKKQRTDLRGLGFFRILGSDGLTYRIGEGTVYLFDGEKPIAGFCAVQKEHKFLPVYDLMLAHKLLLETNSGKFWSIANIRDLDPPPGYVQRVMEVLPIALADLDDPAPWMARRLEEAEQEIVPSG